MQVRKVTRFNRFAVAHPFLATIGSFVLLASWLHIVRHDVRGSLIIAGAVCGVNLLLWLPRVGPLWRYSQRKIEEFDRSPEGQSE